MMNQIKIVLLLSIFMSCTNKKIEKEKVQFISIEKSLYKEFSYIVIKNNENKLLKFKISNDLLNRMTLKQDQDFIVYYIKKNNKKCSIKLERDFAGIDLISNEKKCY